MWSWSRDIENCCVPFFGIVGLAFVNWNSFSMASIPTEAEWPAALLLLIYTYIGFEGSVIATAEARDPLKDAPWALMRALGICAIIYVLLQTVALGTVPNLSSSQRPLADSAQSFMGAAGGTFIAVLACVSSWR
jgi:basic amino acid/polyamine antiporter, APA family